MNDGRRDTTLLLLVRNAYSPLTQGFNFLQGAAVMQLDFVSVGLCVLNCDPIHSVQLSHWCALCFTVYKREYQKFGASCKQLAITFNMDDREREYICFITQFE